MGLIAQVIEFIRRDNKTSDAKIQLGGDQIVNAQHFSPIGEDAQPLQDDYCVALSVNGRGRYATIAYIDNSNEQLAKSGEKRIYSRSEDRKMCAEIWLKNDKSIVIKNDAGSVTLMADGIIDLNGVTIDTEGNVIIPKSLILNGKEIAEHTHNQTNKGITEVNN